MRPSPTSKLPAGTLSDASGCWCVDCDLFWSPSLSDYDEESPPPVKRSACTMHLCQRCSWSPIAQCSYSDLAVCWSCDQYLRWLEKSRAAQKFLDEFLASESGNRPNELPSADYPNITADDVQNEPLHSTSGGVLHNLMKNRPPLSSDQHHYCFCVIDVAGDRLHSAGTVTSPCVGRATSICGGWSNPAKHRSSWMNSTLPNLATGRSSCHQQITTLPLPTMFTIIPGTQPMALNA